MEDLDANRFIHCKEWLARTVEAMVVKQMEPKIMEATSKFQIGGKPGHRPQEHIFCVKSVISKYLQEKRLIIIACYDIKSFFDKEVLGDLMDEMNTIEIDPRAQRLFYKLSRDTRIRVKTSCGLSEAGEAGDIIGQGSGGAAKLSALNLARKLERVFENSNEMASYGTIKQHPYSFQDDILTQIESVEELRSANVKMAETMELMQTQLNESKSGFILMGTEEQKATARQKIKEQPVLCQGFEMKEFAQEKWLGDFLACSLKESVMVTIKKREASIRRASFEIVSLVKDFRADRVGGFRTGLTLWESCAVPTLLYNASTWVDIGREEMKKLNGIQDFFLRLLWQAGPGTPKVALRADTGTRSMEARIWREKIMLIFHIANLQEEDLARRMLTEQEANGWPGLLEEVNKMCNTLNLEHPSKTSMSRKSYNEAVKKACQWWDEANMKKEMERMQNKKMRTMIHENLDLKEYVRKGSLISARKTWQIRSFMLDVAGNYPGHSKYKGSDWRCQACSLELREDQEHLLVCEGYEDLKENLDLRSESEMVNFYQRVMDRRRQMNWS